MALVIALSLMSAVLFGCAQLGNAESPAVDEALQEYSRRTGIEVAELQRREALQVRYGGIPTEIAARPDLFGAPYWGEFPDGTYGLTITYVGDERPAIDTPEGLPIRYEQVRYSRAELAAVAREIRARMFDLEIYKIGAANKSNRIIITAADPERVARELAAYGDMLRFEKGEPETPAEGSPTEP